ncbi:MAG: enoyl-CoA hydratase/isomerase family protein [Oscillospiraceae bacterium]|jgi:enoyl-CoA hydratase|nr:enoyl-CoA hydratase/isomerase family protein [Oscillospiraceae bacterium]
MSYIHITERGYVATLTIDRREAMNALNSDLLTELSESLDKVRCGGARALIITGAGEKAFAAGADIAEMREFSPAQAEEYSKHGNAVMRSIELFEVPVIAAIGGYALGGGCELALSCDIRLASENAAFGFPEVTLGVIPGFGGLQRLTRAIGVNRAALLACTGDRIHAKRALELRLIDELCAQGELMERADALADRIARNAPLAVRAIKRVLRDCEGTPYAGTICAEASAFGGCFGTEDQLSAMGAFLKLNEKRPFVGR